MISRPDLDAVVSHITNYARREPWPSLRHGHLVAFLEPVLDEYGLDLEAVFHEVHQLGHLASMSGFLDESFLSGEHGADRLNPIDDYLRRRGWQEPPRARDYLQGIRNTPPTLFEVQDVAFGEWVDVRDRLAGGPVQRVGEYSASQTLQRWDCFVGRVVAPRGERMFTGGVLSLTRDMATRIEAQYRRLEGAGVASAADRTLFQAWLRALLDAARRPPPELQNTDGDPILLACTRLRLASGAMNEVVRRLDRLDGWKREPGGLRQWAWWSGRKAPSSTVRGMARLERGTLVVETNSRDRMEKALGDLTAALGSLVTSAPTSYADPMRAVHESSERADVSEDPARNGLSSEESAAMAEVVRRAKDMHYRRALGEPIPMLGNRSPRQCRRSKLGRALLVDWLKEIENRELRDAARGGTAPYDMSWMWQELGIDRERSA